MVNVGKFLLHFSSSLSSARVNLLHSQPSLFTLIVRLHRLKFAILNLSISGHQSSFLVDSQRFGGLISKPD